MSLFPAFQNSESEEISKPSGSDVGTLPNFNSFVLPHQKIEENVLISSEESSHEEPKEKLRRIKHKKRSKQKKKDRSEKKDSSNLLYFEDTSVHIEETVPQISLTKPVSSSSCETKRKKKKRKKRKSNKSRYYMKKLEDENEEKILSVNNQPMNIQEFLNKTEEFNLKLRDYPNDIEVWLQYVRLQDEGEGSLRGRGEKKLSILDRALEYNPDSEELFQEKMLITDEIFLLEKVVSEIKAVVAKYPKNLSAWQWLINASQYNLSKMTVPGVILTYETALNGIQKAYHDSKPFLDVVLQCGLFLRQAGLWEQLWTLMELYLELCLSETGSGIFKPNIDLAENEIQNLEDSIITSGLPLGALWLRVEHLREAIYFLPVESSPDPQRIVFSEDVNSLLFPLTPSSYSHLIMVILLLFKVPPLPLTHEIYRYTCLDNIPWSLDSIELLLSVHFFDSNRNFPHLVTMRDLLVGPQYIEEKLGHLQFFNLVNCIFDKCIEHNTNDRVCFITWQLRWWRWLLIMHPNKKQVGAAKDPRGFRNKAKKYLKQYRDCIPLYTEFALLENEADNFEGALKVLDTTIELREPPLILPMSEKRDLLFLYSTHIELLIKTDLNIHKQKILATLIALSFGESVSKVIPTPDLVQRSSERFTHLTTEIVRDMLDMACETPSFSDLMFSHSTVSWLSCHAWFLFVTENIWKVVALLEDVIKKLETKLDKKSPSIVNVMLEGTYHILVNIVSFFCVSNPGHFTVLHDILIRALKIFPNNVYFMSNIAFSELSGLKWQKLFTDILSSGSVVGAVHMFFISHSNLNKEPDLKNSSSTRLYNMLLRLSRDHACQRCPLIWRLLIQASMTKDSEEIKRTFYRAIEKCPWVKPLYYEAVKLLPEDLSEIQDILIEKELRLFITPEELDILREGS